MNKYLLYSILLLIIFSSCKEQDESDFHRFKTEEKLAGHRLNSSDQLLRVNIMRQLGDFLYVADPDEEYVYSVIDVEKDQVVSRFGRLGQGPCEIEKATSLMRVPEDPNRIGAYCITRLSYLEFSMQTVLGNNSKEKADCELQIRNFNQNSSFDQVFSRILKLGKDRFLGVGYFDKKYALYKGDSSKSMKYFFDYHFQDQFPEEHENKSLGMASQGDLVLKPDGSRVFFGVRNFIGFDILSIGQDSLELVKRVEYSPPKFKKVGGENVLAVDFSDENIFGFKSSVASDQFIYALFSGKTGKEDHTHCKWVYVYDWDGNPVKKLELDREVTSITVSEDDDYLIGTVDDGKANLYRFDL